MKTTTTNLFVEQALEIMNDLPPISQNNARSIYRSKLNRYARMKDRIKGVNILQNEFGMDFDYSPKDNGEPPNNYETR